MANYVKFLTNIPEIITFHADTPFKDKTTGELFKINQFNNKQYTYGVEWKGQDAYLSTTETLYNILSRIGNLRDRTLEIMKYEDGQRKLWKITENGQALNAQNSPTPMQNTSTPMQYQIKRKCRITQF